MTNNAINLTDRIRYWGNQSNGKFNTSHFIKVLIAKIQKEDMKEFNLINRSKDEAKLV